MSEVDLTPYRPARHFTSEITLTRAEGVPINKAGGPKAISERDQYPQE